MNNNKLVVLAPCVLGPLGKNTNIDHIPIQTPLLNRLLSVSQKNTIKPKLYCIEQLVLPTNQANDTVAIMQAKQQGVYKNNHDYLLVDLTGLVVAKDHIRLGVKLTDTKQNTQLLVDELNLWYKDKPWQFILSKTGQIFLESPQAFQCKTYPTTFVSGKNISHFIAQSNQENWLAIINELQMILFQSNCLKNKEIKNIWFWGEQKNIANQLFGTQKSDRIIFTDAETALLEQDSEKWLKSLEKLDQLLAKKWSNYQQIQLVLDYHSYYNYKKSVKNYLKSLTQMKKTTLHQWIRLNQ